MFDPKGTTLFINGIPIRELPSSNYKFERRAPKMKRDDGKPFTNLTRSTSKGRKRSTGYPRDTNATVVLMGGAKWRAGGNQAVNRSLRRKIEALTGQRNAIKRLSMHARLDPIVAEKLLKARPRSDERRSVGVTR